MKPYLISRDGARPEDLVGRVLCHQVPGPEGKVLLKKGHILQQDDIPLLLACPWQELHLLELEAGDLTEGEAGERLAHAVAGDGVHSKAAAHGKHTLVAAHRGVLKVDVAALHRVNGLPGIAVYTLFTDQVISRADVVAHAQIAPLTVPRRTIETVEEIACSSGGLLRVLPFAPRVVAVLVREWMDVAARQRFLASFTMKLHWFGCEIRDVVELPDDPHAVTKAVEACIRSGVTLLLLAGGNAMDPLDPFFLALEAAGARLERHGMPAHPGTLLWLASLGGTPVIGLPACGLFSQATVFDLLLPKLLAQGSISEEDVAALGHGGILNRDMAFRFPPYEKKDAAP
ncbi:MAG: hypothetical protein ACE5HK_00865 [Candidatus Methylomirabilales bacterium]